MHSKQSNQDSPKEGWQAETVKNHGNRQVWPIGAEERDVCVILEGVIRGVMGTGSPSDNNLHLSSPPKKEKKKKKTKKTSVLWERFPAMG